MALILSIFGMHAHDWSWPRRFFKCGRWQYRQFCTQCGKSRKYQGELI